MEKISKNEIPEISKDSKPPKKEEKNLIAILSYIGILFLVPLLACKDDAFAQFHAKQGLILFLAGMAIALVAWIPILGWLVGFVGWLLWIILAIIGIIRVLNGKQIPLPIIGKFADRFKI